MSCFSGVLNQSDAFASLNRAWTTGSRPVGAVGLSETGKALVLHALYEQQKKPLLVLTPDEASAVKLTEDLRTLQGDVLLYPAREMNFVRVPAMSTSCCGWMCCPAWLRGRTRPWWRRWQLPAS